MRACHDSPSGLLRQLIHTRYLCKEEKARRSARGIRSARALSANRLVWLMVSGLSAPLGNANLTLGNTCVRSRTVAALGVVCDAAVHRLLDGCTQGTCVRAPVKTRPQNSHVVKLERCAKLTDLSDLMLANRGGHRDGAEAETGKRVNG